MSTPTTTAPFTFRLDNVLELYGRYRDDLRKTRRYQRLLFEERYDEQRQRERRDRLIELGLDQMVALTGGRQASAQLDDVAAEIIYLTVRETRPETVVEISPCGGWSSTWILNALHDNECGHLHSFDIIDHAAVKVPRDLADGWRSFHLGDVKQSEHIPNQIDLLFMDSDHTGEFAQWYLREVFPRVRSGAPVFVDDVYQPGGPAASGGEGTVVLEWLAERGIEFFTVAHDMHRGGLQVIEHHKQQLGIAEPVIRDPGVNPGIYFVMP